MQAENKRQYYTGGENAGHRLVTIAQGQQGSSFVAGIKHQMGTSFLMLQIF